MPTDNGVKKPTLPEAEKLSFSEEGVCFRIPRGWVFGLLHFYLGMKNTPGDDPC